MTKSQDSVHKSQPGLVHRGDCINCETCHFCFDPVFVWPSLGNADFYSA